MSQKGINVHPVRQRAGYLSALSKLYKTVQRLIDTEGTSEDALVLQEKLHDRYTKYFESHEVALASMPERESSLNESHRDMGKRHHEAAEQLKTYIDDVNKTKRSMRVRELFSAKSSLARTAKTASTKHSSRRSASGRMSNSDRLNEARVKAELAKKNLEQYRALKEANQKKIAAERETSRQQMEFKRKEAQRKLELDREAAQRKLDRARQRLELEEQSHRKEIEKQALKEAEQNELAVESESAQRRFELYRQAYMRKIEEKQTRIREAALKQAVIQQRQLKEKTERQQMELEEELKAQRQIAEYEGLRAEVKIREREELRSTLGSDYESSDEERDDVTQPKKTATKTLAFQSIDDQQASMRAILHEFSKPKNVVENKSEPKRSVNNWLDDSNAFATKTLQVPHNTLAQTGEGYIPPVKIRRDIVKAQPTNEKTMQVKTTFKDQSAPQRDVSNWLDQSKPQGPPCKIPAQPRERCVPPIETRQDKCCDQSKPAPANVLSTNEQGECSLIQGQSNAELLNQVLKENPLSKTKITQFDGDPKTCKLFMARFRINIEEVPEECDSKPNLTLLLDHFTGEAYNLNKGCIMCTQDEANRTAFYKHKKQFDDNRLFPRSYVHSVMKRGNFKLINVERKLATAKLQQYDNTNKSKEIKRSVKTLEKNASSGEAFAAGLYTESTLNRPFKGIRRVLYHYMLPTTRFC